MRYNYYNQKNKNKENARIHTYEMSELFSSEIEESISRSKVCTRDNTLLIGGSHTIPKVYFENTDTVTSILNHDKKDSRICALNFASFRNPGGQYINGSMAQEESLCSESYLYNVLKGDVNYYVDNKNFLNGGLYSDRILYTPSIRFERGSKVSKCNVITCAAPNMHYYSKYHKNLADETYYKILYNRAMLIKNVAEENLNHTIILGAWGCGVFENNPEIVAKIFKSVFSDTSIENVVYAIPNSRGDYTNYKTFMTILGFDASR